MSRPTSRRILMAAFSKPDLARALAGFQALQGKGGSAATLELRAHRDGWLELSFPASAPTWAFHNLGVWLSARPEVATRPRVVVLHSVGEGDWDYWLVPGPADHLLTGARGDGTPFQVDVPRGTTLDDPEYRRAPMATELALTTLGVPRALQLRLPGGAEATLPLDLDAHDVAWSICEPGTHPPPPPEVPSGWAWVRRFWTGR